MKTTKVLLLHLLSQITNPEDSEMPLKSMCGKHPRTENLPGPMDKFVIQKTPLPAPKGSVQRGGNK